jgi:AcrR family transcriptional regulator
MSEPAATERPRRSDPTRARILEAARRRFAREGYAATTIRSVAADARIDPSMVMRYYGSKEGLFVAAADIDLRLPELAQTPRADWGERLVRHFFARWDGRPGEGTLALLLRSAATNPHAAERLRTVAAGQIADALARGGVDEPERRAALVASQMVGLAFVRYVLAAPPLAHAPPEQLAADIGPTLQRYLTAPLSS